MASKSNDWSKTVPQAHTKDELLGIMKYAEEQGVQIYGAKNFDGDMDLLREKIDVIGHMKSDYGISQKVTVRFSPMGDDDYVKTVNNTICFNTKALRNCEITNRNLNQDDFLAATNVSGIATHETGHIISQKYGEKVLTLRE